MSHEVETMAYAGDEPWHGLGYKVASNLTAAEMLVAAKLDWTVSRRRVYMDSSFVADEKKTPAKVSHVRVPERYAIARDTDNEVYGLVGPNYKPVQNAVAMDFFKQFVDAGDMQMETAGSLKNGQFIWALAKIGKDFKLGNGDKVEGYLLMMSPHKRGHSLIFQFTPIRVVCWNTLSMALGSSLRGTGGTNFRMYHTTDFNELVRQKAKQALGLATDQMADFKDAATLLTKAKADKKEIKRYFYKVFNLKGDPDAVLAAGDDAKEQKIVGKLDKALTFSPGAQLSTADGTWWGALNAVTFVADHDSGRTRDNGLSSSWFGDMARIKRSALELAIKAAKAA